MLKKNISGYHITFPTESGNHIKWQGAFKWTVLAGLMLIILTGCAKVGKPTGGPKDVNPPVYVEGSPENRSVNFTGEEIDITFDEYIQVKDINREMVISPPLEKRPLTRIREKTIRITLNNELLPLTTYTVNLGNAISDINEGNIIPDFEFVFITGSSIDSLSVTGKVVNAFDKKPAKEEEVLIMLYRNLNDSAPLLEIPNYIGKAGKSGLFSVNNIHADTFRIMALIDANNNRLYEPGSESVAFLDSFLIIHEGNIKPITFIKDTVRIIHPAARARRSGKQASSQTADTTIAPGKQLNALNISLSYFREETNKVIVGSKKRDQREKLSFTFNRPPHDTIRLTPLNFKGDRSWYVKEQSRLGDTLTYWITDTAIAIKDTLNLTLSYLTTDSANRLFERTDTLLLKLQPTTQTGAPARKSKNVAPVIQKKTSMVLTSTLANKGIQNLNRPVLITAAKPLKTINPEAIELFRIMDTVLIKQPIEVNKDAFNIRTFSISCKWEEDQQYRLLLKPGTSTDIFGLTNDSLEILFSTQKIDYYGKILLTIGSDYFPLLVQLLDDKENVVDRKVVRQSGLTVFDYLIPRKYILKAVYDKNGNQKWDTGNYLKHIQPEQVFYHTMSDAVRSNWDHEVTWRVE